MVDTEALDVYVAELNAAEARVRLRLPRSGSMQHLSVQATIHGPRCRYAHTLAARIPFRALHDEQWLALEAIVPDPCYWSGEMPFLYDVNVELRDQGRVINQAKRSLGLRPLTVGGGMFRLAGQNWVPRAGGFAEPSFLDLDPLHEQDTALYLVNPPDAICAQANNLGVWLLVELSGPADNVIADLRRLARHASVGLVAIERFDDSANELHTAAPNILLVQRVTQPAQAIAPWAKAILFPAEPLDGLIEVLSSARLPVIAMQSLPLSANGPASALETRAACDRLQRDLAQAFASRDVPREPAGYVVRWP